MVTIDVCLFAEAPSSDEADGRQHVRHCVAEWFAVNIVTTLLHFRGYLRQGSVHHYSSLQTRISQKRGQTRFRLYPLKMHLTMYTSWQETLGFRLTWLHFIVGTSRLPYAITMLANYYHDSPYVWCGQIIQAKKKCSHRYWQICEQYLREIFDVCVFVYICKKTFLKPPKTQLFEFSSWATWAKTKDCNYIFVQCTSLFWPNNKNKILKHIKTSSHT